MEFFILMSIILVNGLFTMSEIAIISLRKTKLIADVKKGNKKAKTALYLAENPDSFLSTMQVGITLTNILMGIYTGDVLADMLARYLVSIGFSNDYIDSVSNVVMIFVVTYLSIVFGELIPKRIGLHYGDRLAKQIAGSVQLLSKIVHPFAWLLSQSATLIVRLLGMKKEDDVITEDEIITMIQESHQSGEVQAVEQNIIERVFGLGDRTLESIMTHRSEIVYIDANWQHHQIMELIKQNTFSKYPVVNKNLDHIEGVAYLKDLFGQMDNEGFSIKDHAHPVTYFSEKMKVYSALEEMRAKKIEQVFVMDEYGSLQGLITLKDILEGLVGEMPHEDDTPEIVKRQDDTYLVDGQIAFFDFLNYFDREDLYEEFDYVTLGGLIIDNLRAIPREGDTVVWKHFRFEVLDMDGARIDKILVEIINH